MLILTEKSFSPVFAYSFDVSKQTTGFQNDTFDISENSQNLIQTKMISDIQKYDGLIEIMQTAKANVLIVKDGREFVVNESDSFKQINKSFERHIDTGSPKNRSHSEFSKITEYEINRAQMLLAQLCERCTDERYGEINDIFTYEFPKSFEKRIDPKIQATLLSEDLKAKQILDKIFDRMYPSMVFD